MTVKEMKELIMNLSDDVEIEINSIYTKDKEWKLSPICEAHYDELRNKVCVTPETIDIQGKNDKISKFDTNGLIINRFETYHKAIEHLSIVDIAKTYDYIYLLSTFIDPNNEILDDFYNIINPLAKVLKECETEKECPFCNHKLYLSDLPQYDYVCVPCDQNFYSCEVE